MESKDAVQKAIQSHLNWLDAFKRALNGELLGMVDFSIASDEHACNLGRWLDSPQSVEMLGQEYVDRVKNLHGAFHEVAGLVVDSLDGGDPRMTTESLVDGLSDISRGVVTFLEHIKTKVD